MFYEPTEAQSTATSESFTTLIPTTEVTTINTNEETSSMHTTTEITSGKRALSYMPKF